MRWSSFVIVGLILMVIGGCSQQLPDLPENFSITWKEIVPGEPMTGVDNLSMSVEAQDKWTGYKKNNAVTFSPYGWNAYVSVFRQRYEGVVYRISVNGGPLKDSAVRIERTPQGQPQAVVTIPDKVPEEHYRITAVRISPRP